MRILKTDNAVFFKSGIYYTEHSRFIEEYTLSRIGNGSGNLKVTRPLIDFKAFSSNTSQHTK